MKFESWMRLKGLSESSINKYQGAITGALSTWAREAGLIESSILEVTSPAEFSSLSSSIRGLPIFIERNATGHGMYSAALEQYREFLTELPNADIEEDIEQIIENESIGETEKAQLISARVGQGKFRQKLLSYWGKCAVTGYDDPSILVASHIKPWSQSNNAERLDSFNGLLLIPNIDRAFDSGLVSFAEDGQIMISEMLANPEKLGIHPGMRIELKAEHEKYMSWHRSNVFFKPVEKDAKS